MLRHYSCIAIRLFIIMTIITGLFYPAMITLAGRLVFPWQAGGSILRNGPIAIGSLLIAQPTPDLRHFSSRPSAGNYATVPSSASNLAMSCALLHDSLLARTKFWKIPLGDIPPDLVFSSGSGLDPHLSPEAAMLEADRIAGLRGLSGVQVRDLISMVMRRTDRPQLGIFGEKRVNVLLLNCDLEGLSITRDE
jgi:potassium-transporting ATPase KdpC subunit